MLKKVLTAIILLLFATGVYAQQKTNFATNDSAVVRLNNYINQYLSITPLHPDSLINACDYLISLTKDSLVSSHIASYLFNRFYSSDLMGMDGVAVHIAQNYFLNGKVKMPTSPDEMTLRMYVEFNRNSLIGMDAPELNILSPDNMPVSLREVNSRYTILYFFDDQCAVCKAGLPGLIGLSDSLASEGVSVFAVYTQSQRENLKKYIKEEFTSKGLGKNWIFAWDPSLESDFPRLYNVIKTPQIFLLNNDKKIIGRNLNNEALSQLLKAEINRGRQAENRINDFLDSYLNGIDLTDTAKIRKEIDPLFQRISAQKDKELYRSVFTNLFDKMLYADNDSLKDAAVYIAKRYITPYPGFWWDKTYPLEWVPKMVERIQNNKIGSVANDMVLLNKKGRPVKLSSVNSKYTVLYFIDPDCSICKPFSMEFKKIYNSLKKRGVTVISINSGGNSKEFFEYNRKNKNPWLGLSPRDENYYELFDKFETEQVPMIYLLDNNRRILAKKINTITLDKLVK